MTVEKPILEVLSPIANGGELFRKDLRVMGGVATAAAINPAAEIDAKARTVSLSSADFRETNIRENGSLRDLDALVLREKSDPEFIEWKQEISRRLGADLVANIFGLRTADEWKKETASPLSALMLRAGDRYQTADGETMKLLSPWVAEIPAASLEPWQYVFRGFDDAPEITFQGLNPANDLVNRLTRTTILRPRDLAKISAVLNLVENNPQLSDWLATGAVPARRKPNLRESLCRCARILGIR
jgi:hypothetical protein